MIMQINADLLRREFYLSYKEEIKANDEQLCLAVTSLCCLPRSSDEMFIFRPRVFGFLRWSRVLVEADDGILLAQSRPSTFNADPFQAMEPTGMPRERSSNAKWPLC